MSRHEFYTGLKNTLPQSTGAERKIWAQKIIAEEVDIKVLSNLLFCEESVASRFLWLLSDIGEENPNTLLHILPYLLDIKDEINYAGTAASFANYWLIAGVPLENEGIVIDLLFEWIRSNTMNVTTKSRALFVLFKLTHKYPELKNELKLCIEDQMNKNTADFGKRAQKVLDKLAM